MQEGYVIYDPVDESYFTQDGCPTDVLNGFMFTSLDAAYNDLVNEGWESPETYEIHKIKRNPDILERYKAKITFEIAE
jgi:hypothetical protein